MFILLDVEGIPVQMVVQGSMDRPIFFHSLARLCEIQRKRQPSLLMTKRTWDHLRRPDVTHEGAFGDDFFEIPTTVMKERFVDAPFDPHTTTWVVVWKFPGDLNYLKHSNGEYVFRRIHHTPLPVGEYPLVDDGWTKAEMSHPDFPKHEMAQKWRTDFPSGDSIHFLEHRNGKRIAMIGSNFFIRDFWRVTHRERRNVVTMINRIETEVGLCCFVCFGQHHAIVFYVDERRDLITPSRLSNLLQTTSLSSILDEYSFREIKSWVSNINRFASTIKPPWFSGCTDSPIRRVLC